MRPLRGGGWGATWIKYSSWSRSTRRVSVQPSQHPRQTSYTTCSPLTTTGDTGSAVLVVEGDNLKALKLWMKVVGRVHQDTVTLAFPDLSGAPLQHLERKMDVAAKALGHSLPISTEFRKGVEIRNQRLDDPSRQAVSRALSHSLATAAQYYQAPTQQDGLRAFQSIRALMDEDPPTDPPPPPPKAHSPAAAESSRLVEGVSTLTRGTYVHSASTFCDVFIHHLFFKLLLFSFFCAISYLAGKKPSSFSCLGQYSGDETIQVVLQSRMQ